MTPCHVCTLAPCRCDAVLAGIALVGAGLLLAAGPRVRSALGVFVNGLFLLPPAASEPEEPGADFDRRVVTIASCWLRAARRLLHEEMQAPERADLHTTDGLIISAARALNMMRIRIHGLGGTVDGEVETIIAAVRGRADKLRRERAMESAKRRPAPGWEEK